MQTAVRNGGTYHSITGASAVKVSGTWRTLKQIWVKSGGVWRQVFTSTTFSGSMTADWPGFGHQVGYRELDFGTLSPISDSNGHIIQDIYTDNVASPPLFLNIRNFGSDPGQGYFGTLTTNGNSYPSSSATSYSYAGGVASWQWNALADYAIGSNYTVVLG